jgi:hypothetical protein
MGDPKGYFPVIYKCTMNLQCGWTFQLLQVDTSNLWGSTTHLGVGIYFWLQYIHRNHVLHSVDPSVWENYSTQGSGALCYVSCSFFSGFFRISLTETSDWPSTWICDLTCGLRATFYMECDFAITFSIWFVYYKNAIEDLWEKNSEMLGNCSRRLQDYSRLAGPPSSLVIVQVLLKTSSL